MLHVYLHHYQLVTYEYLDTDHHIWLGTLYWSNKYVETDLLESKKSWTHKMSTTNDSLMIKFFTPQYYFQMLVIPCIFIFQSPSFYYTMIFKISLFYNTIILQYYLPSSSFCNTFITKLLILQYHCLLKFHISQYHYLPKFIISQNHNLQKTKTIINRVLGHI